MGKKEDEFEIDCIFCKGTGKIRHRFTSKEVNMLFKKIFEINDLPAPWNKKGLEK